MILTLLALNGYLKLSYILAFLGPLFSAVVIVSGNETTTKEWTPEARGMFSALITPLCIALNVWFVNYVTSFVQ